MLNELFGPSIHLLVLDMFLENPEELINLRGIARKVDKNPGSISRVMPLLVENGLIEQIKVGKTMYVYRINENNEVVHLILEFYTKLKNLYNQESNIES